MKIKTTNFSVYTEGNSELIDITDNVNEQLRSVGFSEGNVLVFVPGSTAGITTIEYEPGLIKDYPKFFEKIIPSNQTYHHNETWHDGNGHSHVRASLQGGSITVPFVGEKLLLGTWQQIILIDFDVRARQRKVLTQFIGE